MPPFTYKDVFRIGDPFGEYVCRLFLYKLTKFMQIN